MYLKMHRNGWCARRWEHHILFQLFWKGSWYETKKTKHWLACHYSLHLCTLTCRVWRRPSLLKRPHLAHDRETFAARDAGGDIDGDDRRAGHVSGESLRPECLDRPLFDRETLYRFRDRWLAGSVADLCAVVPGLAQQYRGGCDGDRQERPGSLAGYADWHAGEWH